MLVQHVLEIALRDAGFAVTVAFNGEEARKLFDSQPTHFRALVTDVNLGAGLNGWDLARHAREIASELPVIYTTATPDEWSAQGVPNSIVIAKPYAAVQVITAVSQLINASSAPAAIPPHPTQ